ncbi:MAG TPA: prolyl oligopeptidase family serine peptidase [Cryomorphaceae bacterium]|nr:prolyl oligopeptidase family serine peptidase [Cryomorphaceae bacterium]
MRFIPILVMPLLVVACTDSQSMKDSKEEKIEYPETRKTDVTDDYFGTTVADPYRWLEDDRAEETENWVKAQNETTQKYLERIPYRDQIEQRLTQLFDYPRVSSPRRVGEYYFFYKNSGLQNQSVLYYQKGRDGEPQVFIDPNALSEDGTVSINLLSASPDEKYIAYSRSEGGSDWSEIRIREIATNTELDDRLEWVKFSGSSWVGDGFYYSRYPEPEPGSELSGDNRFHSVYFHKVGTPQSEDKLFYSNENAPNLYHFVGVTEDKKYLTMSAASGTDGFETFIKDLENDGELTRITHGFANKTSIVDHHDGKLLALTDIDAPNYRLVSIDPTNFGSENWVDVIPESDRTLVNVSTAGGYLFAHYLADATSQVDQYEYDGTLVRSVEFPGPGSVGGFSGKKDDSTVFYTYYSFTYPPTIFEYDPETGESEVFNKVELNFNPEDYVARQEWYKSKDGTEVPMFVVHKKDLKKDGNNPTMLYGYGGFNISITPSFSTSNIVFLENGGVYAVANLRGGGEFGEEWHRAGMLDKKQNVFDDFIAAAEYLIDEGYTSPEKLAVKGRSNGGLLVGAVMTQRPDLFAVALPGVGVLDMLRYQKFTVGKGWVPEYGSADSSKTEFEYLYAYSPLHNLREGVTYPSTFVTTGDHDDRVVPAHSFKFAATLQELHGGNNPVLIRIETDGGHGAGKPIAKIIAEQADEWAFAMWELGMRELPGTPAPTEGK